MESRGDAAAATFKFGRDRRAPQVRDDEWRDKSWPMTGSVTSGSVIGMALDARRKRIAVYVNGKRLGLMVQPKFGQFGVGLGPGPYRWGGLVGWGAEVRIDPRPPPLEPISPWHPQDCVDWADFCDALERQVLAPGGDDAARDGLAGNDSDADAESERWNSNADAESEHWSDAETTYSVRAVLTRGTLT